MRTKSVGLISALAALLVTAQAIAQDVTLDVTAWKGNEAEPAGLPELIEKFETEHPDIKVKLNYISRGDTGVVVPPRLQGDNPPDVMMVDMPLVKIWGEAGLLADLGQDREWFSRVSPSIKDSITSGDEIYILPLEIIGMGNFVNMARLREAGIDEPPLTVDALLTACQKLREIDVEPMVFSGSLSATLFTIANGLDRSDEPASNYGSGKSKFESDPGFNETLNIIRDLVAADCFNPIWQAAFDPWAAALSEFRAGKFAMMIHGAWNIINFQQTKDLDFVLAPIPARSDTGVALDLFGMGWAISEKSRNRDAARTFVEFFSVDENLAIFLRDEAAYSPFEGGTGGVPDLASYYDKARANGGTIMFPYAVLHWPSQLESVTWDSLTGFLLDIDTPNESTLSRWDQAVEDNE